MSNIEHGAQVPQLTPLTKVFTSERSMAVLILLSAFVIFIDGFNFNPTIDSTIIYFHWIVTLLFLIEAYFKIRILSFKRYFTKTSNRFDFTLACLSLLFISMPSITIGSIGYLRLLRLVTILRSVRLIPNSEKIFSGLIRALSASKAVLAMLLIILFIFSMIGFTLFSTELPNYFGTPLSSMNTIFGIFTIENWTELPEIAKVQSETLYYMVNAFTIIVLVIGGFIALSLANAIFVDEMVADNNDEVLKKLADLKQENKEIKQLLQEMKQETKG